MSYKDRALAMLKALLDDPSSDHGRALRLLIVEMIGKRDRHRQHVLAGLDRARAQGRRLGRPRLEPLPIQFAGATVREAGRAWGVSKSTAARWIRDQQRDQRTH